MTPEKFSWPILAILFASVLSAIGQVPQRQVPWNLQIEEIEVNKIRNPNDGVRSPGIPPDTSSEWVRISVEYSLVAGQGRAPSSYSSADIYYSNNVEFDWTVIFPVEVKSNVSGRASVRMKKTVKYQNVGEGDKRYAVIYISPWMYKRYKERLHRDLVFVQLAVRIDGRTLAQGWCRGKNTFTANPRDRARLFPEFRNIDWFSHEEVTDVEGLRTRLETPWEWAGGTYYEQIADEKRDAR